MTEQSQILNQNRLEATLLELLDHLNGADSLTEEELLNTVPELQDDLELNEAVREALVAAEISVVNEEHDGQSVAQAEMGNDGEQDFPLWTTYVTSATEQAIDLGDRTGAYLSQVGQVPLLTRDEELDLAKRIERGAEARRTLASNGLPSAKRRARLEALIEDGIAAREHLILANSRLVISVAKKYKGQGIPFRDLMQEGHIGLMRAVKKFDYRRGFKFSTYATWWIRQAISRAVADFGRTVRIPVHMMDRIRKMLRLRNQLIQQLGRPPSVTELAEPLETAPDKVSRMLRYAQRTDSLDRPLGDVADLQLADVIEDEQAPKPEQTAEEVLMEEEVLQALESLSPREAQVLRLRHGIPNGISLSLQEIGTRMGVTRERIRQIEATALRKLRRSKHRLALQLHLRGT